MYNVTFDCNCGMEQVIEVDNGIETTVTCFNCNKDHVVQISAIVDEEDVDNTEEESDETD